MISSFISAVYCDEIKFIEKIIAKVSDIAENAKSQHLILASGVLEYTKYTSSTSKYTKSKFNELKRPFSNCCNSKHPYVRAIARHYVGRCLVKEAYLQQDEKVRVKFLEFALGHFKMAENEFELCEIDESSKMMWLAFLQRHLARTYHGLKNTDLALEYAEKALRNREDLVVRLQNSYDNAAFDAFEAEYYLSVIDYVLISKDRTFAPYEEMQGILQGPQVKTSKWWAKVARDYRLTENSLSAD
ncbi:hypothetical protein [Geminicoccus roseus]|uniref:hypothetical protein n=1 Tax=Geminicoccus roseus TaxID=404900 RepID=UPI0012F77AAB|nr:hypothetical protein [Geminicoccus roseus]